MSNAPPPPDEWPPPQQPPSWGTPPPPGAGGYQPPPAQPYVPGAGMGSSGPGGATLAEPGRRLIARIIDFVIFLVLYLAFVIALVVALADTTTTATSASANLDGTATVLALAFFVVYWLYESLMAVWRGQTLGKMLMGIRIVDEAGATPGMGAAMKRSSVWLTPMVPCCIGLIAFLVLEVWGLVNMFNGPDRRTLMDQFAATLVVDAR